MDATTRSPPPESAEYHILRNVPSARRDATCGEILQMLRLRCYEYADVVVIIDEAGAVLGMASTGELAAQSPDTTVRKVMHPGIVPGNPGMDQEHVASLALDNALGAVPVVDERGRFIGLVPPQTLLAVLRREHIEDLHRLTGILRETEVARDAIEGPPVRRAVHRLPWLFVGVAGSAVAALVMAQFEAVLRAHLVLIFFLPGIVYIADAIGTQTEAIAVRGLSISRSSLSTLLMGELWTGLLIGAILGGTSFLALWAVMGDSQLALTVAIAVFAASGLATGIGLVLPWTFHKLGFDPAYGSGPLATVIQDVLSLLVYFACVVAFLSDRG
jgi:magnesium transporter